MSFPPLTVSTTTFPHPPTDVPLTIIYPIIAIKRHFPIEKFPPCIGQVKSCQFSIVLFNLLKWGKSQWWKWRSIDWRLPSPLRLPTSPHLYDGEVSRVIPELHRVGQRLQHDPVLPEAVHAVPSLKTVQVGHRL